MSNSKKLKKQMGVVIDRLDGKYYAVADFCAYELNEVSARILDLCDGKNSINDIAAKLSKHYCQDIELVTKDVEEFISEALSKNLIKSIF